MQVCTYIYIYIYTRGVMRCGVVKQPTHMKHNIIDILNAHD